MRASSRMKKRMWSHTHDEERRHHRRMKTSGKECTVAHVQKRKVSDEKGRRCSEVHNDVARMRNTLSHAERAMEGTRVARGKIFFPSHARVRAVMHAKEDIEDAPSRTRMRHRRALNEAPSHTEREEGAVAHENEVLSRTE
jgi:hypothetical protein